MLYKFSDKHGLLSSILKPPKSPRLSTSPGFPQRAVSAAAVVVMAIPGRWPSPRCCRSCPVLLVLLLAMPAAHAAAAATEASTASLQKSCPPLTECAGGVANLGCCKAIQSAIDGTDNSCVCKQLSLMNRCGVDAKCMVLCPSCSIKKCETRNVETSASSLTKSCPELGDCGGGQPNQKCCTAIQSAINGPDNSCVCKQLSLMNRCGLDAKCSKVWCPSCGRKACKCGTMDVEGAYAY